MDHATKKYVHALQNQPSIQKTTDQPFTCDYQPSHAQFKTGGQCTPRLLGPEELQQEAALIWHRIAYREKQITTIAFDTSRDSENSNATLPSSTLSWPHLHEPFYLLLEEYDHLIKTLSHPALAAFFEGVANRSTVPDRMWRNAIEPVLNLHRRYTELGRDHLDRFFFDVYRSLANYCEMVSFMSSCWTPYLGRLCAFWTEFAKEGCIKDAWRERCRMWLDGES